MHTLTISFQRFPLMVRSSSFRETQNDIIALQQGSQCIYKDRLSTKNIIPSNTPLSKCEDQYPFIHIRTFVFHNLWILLWIVLRETSFSFSTLSTLSTERHMFFPHYPQYPQSYEHFLVSPS